MVESASSSIPVPEDEGDSNANDQGNNAGDTHQAAKQTPIFNYLTREQRQDELHKLGLGLSSLSDPRTATDPSTVWDKEHERSEAAKKEEQQTSEGIVIPLPTKNKPDENQA